MPLVQTRGAASAQGFGEFAQAAAAVNYIEDVFSCFLYTGTGSAQTITNNIDTSTYGGLTWIKGRSGATGHRLTDTARGVTKSLASETTAAEATETTGLTAFGTTGFTIGADADYNTSAATYVSWTFRKQPKFFDIVTYTGNGTLQNIAHNLGSTPGCILVKSTSAVHDWAVYHSSLGATKFLKLNSTASAATASSLWNDTNPSSTTFTVGSDGDTNDSGTTYVAYLFANDAGGFGLSGTDNVISCGIYTGNGGVLDVNVGFEPQWLLVKRATQAAPWMMVDNMRGAPVLPSYASYLRANASDAEVANAAGFHINSTGFNVDGFNFDGAFNGEYIYIAIRRGPMKVPTSGTSVFKPVTRTGTGADATVTGVGFAPDLAWIKDRGGNFSTSWDRLRGATKLLRQTGTSAEETFTDALTGFDVMDGVRLGTDNTAQYINLNAATYINWNFKRAPSVFDIVCYTGTGTAGQTYTHNLGVVPELMIVKGRSIAEEWNVYFGNNTNYLKLNRDDVPQTATTRWNDTSPTSSVFSLGTSNWVNQSGSTYVAYLFASLAGVSKVGSYTGNGTTQTINCGFTGGARFVLIKRTDALGGWYTYDTARGMTVLTDPYLLMNSTAAEVATLGSVTTVSTGFAVNNAILAGINAASPAAYIFLAIA